MTDAELDARFAALAEVPPPPALAVRTLARVQAERDRERLVADPPAPGGWFARVRARRWALVAALLGVVAFNLARFEAPEVARPDALVPRGSAEVPPTLDLRAAVRRGASVERFAVGARYAAGDTLLFRVTTPTATTVRLSRAGVLLWSGPVPAGESDLPVGYTLEAGEVAASFVVEADTGAHAVLAVEAVSP